jgi:SAM-dependent methyltransferase
VTQGQDRTAELLLQARLALISHQVAVSGTDPQVVRLPENALPELIRAFAGTADTVYQLVPVSGRPKNLDLFSLLVWRRHAMKGHDVRRLYLVPFGNPDAERILLQVEDDNASRIIAHRLYAGASSRDRPARDPAGESVDAAVPMTNMWIVDNRVVVYEEYGDNGPPSWVVSARKEEVRTARARWDQLWEKRSELEHEAPRVPEPLLESADMVHSIAQYACTGDHVDADGCAWYHGSWQYLRLFNLVSSPNWHARFYEEHLRLELHAHARPRVLITGAADYGMLAYVLAAADRPENLDVHVADLCHTPLLANRWLGRRHGVDVAIHAVDFLDRGEEFAADLGPVDLVVSDAFLTRFERGEAERVVENWRRVLRPGGCVVTTVRLHDLERSVEDQSRAETEYLLRLYERAKSSHWLLEIDFDDLHDAAREYVRRMRSRPIGGQSEIESIFVQHGFRITKAEVGHVDGELQPATYLRIVAHG